MKEQVKEDSRAIGGLADGVEQAQKKDHAISLVASTQRTLEAL